MVRSIEAAKLSRLTQRFQRLSPTLLLTDFTLERSRKADPSGSKLDSYISSELEKTQRLQY